MIIVEMFALLHLRSFVFLLVLRNISARGFDRSVSLSGSSAASYARAFGLLLFVVGGTNYRMCFLHDNLSLIPSSNSWPERGSDSGLVDAVSTWM